MTYEDYVSLVLNAPRIRMQWAVAHLHALLSANNEELGHHWGDALASDVSEAEEILAEINHARSRARAAERRGPF